MMHAFLCKRALSGYLPVEAWAALHRRWKKEDDKLKFMQEAKWFEKHVENEANELGEGKVGFAVDIHLSRIMKKRETQKLSQQC